MPPAQAQPLTKAWAPSYDVASMSDVGVVGAPSAFDRWMSTLIGHAAGNLPRSEGHA